jgi:hypothetical protein
MSFGAESAVTGSSTRSGQTLSSNLRRDSLSLQQGVALATIVLSDGRSVAVTIDPTGISLHGIY